MGYGWDEMYETQAWRRARTGHTARNREGRLTGASGALRVGALGQRRLPRGGGVWELCGKGVSRQVWPATGKRVGVTGAAGKALGATFVEPFSSQVRRAETPLGAGPQGPIMQAPVFTPVYWRHPSVRPTGQGPEHMGST